MSGYWVVDLVLLLVAVCDVDQVVVDLDNSGIHRGREGRAVQEDPSLDLSEDSCRSREEGGRVDPSSAADHEHAEVGPWEVPFQDVPLVAGPSDQDHGSCSVVASRRLAQDRSQREVQLEGIWIVSVAGPYRGREDRGMIEACRTGR
jgi:hypothetical protein